MAKTFTRVSGYEYDWLGVDERGHVALFSTAGGSYAPQAFLADTDAHADAIDAVLAMPESTFASRYPKIGPGKKNRWLRVAERGLFAYDGDFNGGDYDLVAVPMSPIHVESLPPAIAVVARRIRCPFRFETRAVVSEADLAVMP